MERKSRPRAYEYNQPLVGVCGTCGCQAYALAGECRVEGDLHFCECRRCKAAVQVGEKSFGTYSRYNGLLRPTAPDVLGPFYRPLKAAKKETCDTPSLHLHGQVRYVNSRPVGGATVEVWHADSAGAYDEHGSNCRGLVHTDTDGVYSVLMLRPGGYSIALGRRRCSHVHICIGADGLRLLITQLYFADDPDNAADPFFSADRCVGPDGRFDFVLQG